MYFKPKGDVLDYKIFMSNDHTILVFQSHPKIV